MKQPDWALACLILWTVLTIGCASPPFPQSSLTGQVVEVSIGEHVTPHAVTVKQGDEISWVNTTTNRVDIWFVQNLDGIISCQRGFVSSGWGYMFAGSEPEGLIVATIGPNGTASLCFGAAGTYAYRVHIKNIPDGHETKIGGSITIE